MAITVTSLATPVRAGTGNPNTVATTASLAIGDTAVVIWEQFSGSSADTLTVTDASGNIWNKTGVAFQANGHEMAIFKSNITVPLAAGGLLSLASSSTRTKQMIYCFKLQGAADFDITAAVTSGGAAATMQISNFGPTVSDGDILFAAFGAYDTAGTIVLGGTWTEFTEVSTTGVGDHRLTVGYKVVGAHPVTTTIAPTVQTPGASTWVAVAVAIAPVALPRQAFVPSADIQTSGSSHTGPGGFFNALSDVDNTTTVTTPNAGVLIFKLSSNALSPTKTGWQFELNGKYDNSSGSDFVELFQGTSWVDASSRPAIASGTVTYGAALSLQTVSLNSTQAGNVTDGTALYMRITTTAA